MIHLQLVRAYLDTAVANNLNVMRIWAQTVGFNRAPFQTSPGVYNENIFRGLDYALDQARQRNIKVGCAIHSVTWSQHCPVYCLLRCLPVEPLTCSPLARLPAPPPPLVPSVSHSVRSRKIASWPAAPPISLPPSLPGPHND